MRVNFTIRLSSNASQSQYLYIVFQLLSTALNALHGLLFLWRPAPRQLAGAQGVAAGARPGRTVGGAAGQVLGATAVLLLSQRHARFVPGRERVVRRRTVGQRAQMHHIYGHLGNVVFTHCLGKMAFY